MSKPRSFFNALKWSYVGSLGDKAFSALFTLILAGLLGPTDFGVVSISLIFISLFQLLLDQGLADALIQRKNVEGQHFDTVFWTNLGLSIFLFAGSFFIGRYWAAATHAPDAAAIIPVLSISIIFESLSIVQISVLKRNLDFKSLSIRVNVSVVLSGIVGIVLALAGFRVWSLVAQQIVRDLSALVMLWRLSPWRPRWSFSLRHLIELLPFSIPCFVARLGVFVEGQASSIILGLFFGPTAVGLYRVAERVVGSIVSVATSATQAVSLPEFARNQDDLPRLREAALACIRISASVTVPALVGIAMVSNELMSVVGLKWIAAAPVLRVLCALCSFQIFTLFTGPLLQATGKTRAHAILEWARTVASTAILLGAALLVRNRPDNWQVLAIAFARFVTGFFLITPVYVYVLARQCALSVTDIIRGVAPSAVTSLSIILVILLFRSFGWSPQGNPIFRLAILVVVGSCAGLPVLLMLDRQLRNTLVSLFGKISLLAGRS